MAQAAVISTTTINRQILTEVQTHFRDLAGRGAGEISAGYRKKIWFGIIKTEFDTAAFFRWEAGANIPRPPDPVIEEVPEAVISERWDLWSREATGHFEISILDVIKTALTGVGCAYTDDEDALAQWCTRLRNSNRGYVSDEGQHFEADSRKPVGERRQYRVETCTILKLCDVSADYCTMLNLEALRGARAIQRESSQPSRKLKKLSKFDKEVGELWRVAMERAASRGLRKCRPDDLNAIADQLDKSFPRPLNYLERSGRKAVAEFNREKSLCAITTWAKLAASPGFQRHMRVRLSRAAANLAALDVHADKSGQSLDTP